MTLGLGMQHLGLGTNKVRSNDDLGLTLTFFTARSNLLPYSFIWENIHFFRKNVKKSFNERNLQQMTEVTRCCCWHQNFVPKELSAAAPGLYTCIKAQKSVYKKQSSKGFFWNLQHMGKVIRPSCWHWHIVGQGFAVLVAGAGWVGCFLCVFFISSILSFLFYCLISWETNGHDWNIVVSAVITQR